MRHWWACLCDKLFVGHENAIQNAPCNRLLNESFFQVSKLCAHFDVFSLSSSATATDAGCTGIPKCVTRLAFVHCLAARLGMMDSDAEREMLREVVMVCVKTGEAKGGDQVEIERLLANKKSKFA
jgi:hypothetical protein